MPEFHLLWPHHLLHYINGTSSLLAIALPVFWVTELSAQKGWLVHLQLHGFSSMAFCLLICTQSFSIICFLHMCSSKMAFCSRIPELETTACACRSQMLVKMIFRSLLMFWTPLCKHTSAQVCWLTGGLSLCQHHVLRRSHASRAHSHSWGWGRSIWMRMMETSQRRWVCAQKLDARKAWKRSWKIRLWWLFKPGWLLKPMDDKPGERRGLQGWMRLFLRVFTE